MERSSFERLRAIEDEAASRVITKGCWPDLVAIFIGAVYIYIISGL